MWRSNAGARRATAEGASRSPFRPAQSAEPQHLLRLKKYLFLYAGVVLLVGWAFGIAYVFTDHQRTFAAARTHLLSLAIALNSHTEAIFADGLGAAHAAANHLASNGGLSQIPAQQAMALLHNELTVGRYVAALFVASPDRVLVAGRSDYWSDERPLASWLRAAFLESPAFFIGAPMPYPAKPGQLVIPIARKVTGQDGVVYAGAWFDVEALRKRYASVLPQDGVMGLVTEDGGILAQEASGTLTSVPTRHGVRSAAIYRYAAQQAHGRPTIITADWPNGIDMVYAVSRPEPEALLIAVVGLTRQSIVAPWRARTWAVLSLAGLSTIALLLLTRLLFRYIDELSCAQDALARINETLEQRVASRTSALQRANEELEAFNAAASHDLRAPLTTISGQAGLLALNLGDGAGVEARDRLERIQSSVHRAAEVIDGLLSLARVSRHELQSEEVSLSALVHECIGEIREREPMREVDSHIQEDVVVMADPRLMKSLIANLVSNAWKYSTDKQRVEIEFSCEHDDANGTVYRITDHGAGFDMSYAARLFQPFQRLHSISEFPGTGIGLATVARIVRRYDGIVSAHGEVGQGATFYFTLPLAQPDR